MRRLALLLLLLIACPALARPVRVFNGRDHVAAPAARHAVRMLEQTVKTGDTVDWSTFSPLTPRQ